MRKYSIKETSSFKTFDNTIVRVYTVKELKADQYGHHRSAAVWYGERDGDYACVECPGLRLAMSSTRKHVQAAKRHREQLKAD